jgi:hypothetical protein
MTEDDYKYIYTKRRVYRLPKDAKGIPIEEAYPGGETPAFLKGAVIYDTPRGRIVARQGSAERSGEESGSNARQERPHAIGENAGEARPPAAERPEPPLEIKEKPPGRQDQPMRFFRRDAPGQSTVADPWQRVRIICQEAFAVRPEKRGIENPAKAAREVRVLLARHFPEGPAIAAQSRQAARRWNSAADRALKEGTEAPERSDPARRWSGFCRDYASTLKEAQAEGLAPAACNPYADIDFSAADRERRDASKARSSRERDGFER